MVKLSNPITSIVGSIGNVNFKRDKFCLHCNPQIYKRRKQASTGQRAVRNSFTYCRRIFYSDYMSDGFRDEWLIYAQSHPVLNRIGESITLTGLLQFMKINIPRHLNSLPLLLQPCDLNYI